MEELESRLYSQVFHSTENWDQSPDHPVLSKAPERQITKYSISNQTVNAARYWDGTQAKNAHVLANTVNDSTVNANTVNNSAVANTVHVNTVNNSAVVEKPTTSSETNDNDNTLQNNNQQNISRTVGLVEEYIELESTYNQNEGNIDFSKDDFLCQQNFFYNTQNKLIQQIETQNQVATAANNLNNNTAANNNCNDLNLIAELVNQIKQLEQENTSDSLRKARNLTSKLKKKQAKVIKYERRTNRLLKKQAREEKKRMLKLGLIPKNNAQSFSFVNQYNSIQRKSPSKNFNLLTSPINLNQSPIVEQSETNESIKNQQKEINVDDSFVILSDSDSDSDEVIEVPLPADEIVCIDSSSEISDADDTICADNNIVESPKITTTTNLTASPKTLYSINEENIVPAKLENSNDSETNEINKSQIKGDEIVDNTIKEQILKSEEDNIENIEVMRDIEENATTLSEIEEKNDESKSPEQPRSLSTTSINEIEKERAELLCTPDSNTNDFMAHDVCTLNKSNFSFNFNLHGSDLGISGKEISKSGPSITDVYETESSCSEAGTTSKNRSYFSEVDFESPNKEIFAEPDLAKFSSFITPIRNRNISNVANSTPDLAQIKTKAGVVDPSSFKLNLFNNDGSCSSDEFNSDPTVLPVKKKTKKKKKKAKKKDTNEIAENTTEDNVIQEQTEVSNNTTEISKSKKNKKKNKVSTHTELKHECFLSNQTEAQQEKLRKAKEKKLKKKNKRKSGQMENEQDTDSSNKKPKNVTNVTKEKSDTQTKQTIENQKSEISNAKTLKDVTQNTNKDSIESLPDKNVCQPELNSTDEYCDKVDSYFADDVLYKELEASIKPECSSNSLKNTATDATEQIDIDTLSSNSDTHTEKLPYTDTFRKTNENETQIIDISSDSDAEIPQLNDENTSSSGGNNVVLNIFSPEKSNNDERQDIVANPFSFVQNFDKLNHKKSFKDIWTNDMNSFYNESWGHEEYDITAVHQSMPCMTSFGNNI